MLPPPNKILAQPLLVMVTRYIFEDLLCRAKNNPKNLEGDTWTLAQEKQDLSR